MFVLINDIVLQNLPEGRIESRTISKGEVVDLILEHRGKSGIVAAFDVGPVPDERKQARFREALEIIRTAGLPLSEGDFQIRTTGEEGEALSCTTAPEMCRLGKERPLLVIIYSYKLVEGARPKIAPDPQSIKYRLFSLVS